MSQLIISQSCQDTAIISWMCSSTKHRDINDYVSKHKLSNTAIEPPVIMIPLFAICNDKIMQFLSLLYIDYNHGFLSALNAAACNMGQSNPYPGESRAYLFILMPPRCYRQQ